MKSEEIRDFKKCIELNEYYSFDCLDRRQVIDCLDELLELREKQKVCCGVTGMIIDGKCENCGKKLTEGV